MHPDFDQISEGVMSRKRTMEKRRNLTCSVRDFVMKSLYFFVYFYLFSIFHMPKKLDVMRVFGTWTAKIRKNSISQKYTSLRMMEAFL